MNKYVKAAKGNSKIEKSMHEFKEGTLHSGLKSGPVVTNKAQAIAIGFAEQRKKKNGGY